MNKTISVIIPVYNVAAYLPACMDSVLSQSYRELEVILIDDGSTDRSGTLCDDYAAKDSRVRVIHQQNGGAAAAKNAGLRAATGEYLAFLDSDDYLETDAYEYMEAKMREQAADVVQCAFRDVYIGRTVDCVISESDRSFSTEEYVTRYTVDWTCGMMTDKLFKRALFDGIFFEEGNKIDDEFFTYRGVMNAKKIVYAPKVVYNYRKRASSVMFSHESASRIVADRLDYTQKRRKNVLARFANLKQAYDAHYADTLILLYRDPFVTEDTQRDIKQSIKDFLRERPAPAIGFRCRLALLKILYGWAAIKQEEHPKPVVNKDEFFE